MKHRVTTGRYVMSPVALPTDSSRTTEKVQPDRKLIHRTHSSSADDPGYEICRDLGRTFRDSLFEVSGNMKKSSYTSLTTCTS